MRIWGADQVQSSDHLGDGVFHLDARVHLDEEPLMPVQIVKELDGPSVVVADFPGNACRSVAQLADHVFRQTEGRGDLDHFLMAALHRAIAFVEMNDVAMAVTEDLHLDVLGAGNIFLQEHC